MQQEDKDNAFSSAPLKRVQLEPEVLTTGKVVTTHSPFKLYQMAIPHIINSNNRVQQLISIESKKQKVQEMKIFS